MALLTISDSHYSTQTLTCDMLIEIDAILKTSDTPQPMPQPLPAPLVVHTNVITPCPRLTGGRVG